MTSEFKILNSNLSKIDSILLAKFILAKVGIMSHLKLQKLIFYCEAYHLAYFENSLIDDDFQAWVHGPVSTKIWGTLKEYSTLYGGIGLDQKHKSSIIKKVKNMLCKEQYLFIGDILKEFGKRTSYELECLTHDEKPWIEARGNTPPTERSNKKISKITMKKFYKEKIYSM